MRSRSNAAHDDRLDDGMREQRALVAAREASGASQCGWKAGFGAPAARERFALDAPLVGALLDRTRLDPGSVVPIGTWRDPRAEAEIAVLLGADVAPGASSEQAWASVAGLAPAIELVDLPPAPDTPAAALAGNLFHRHWITGSFEGPPAGPGLSGLVAEVHVMGGEPGRIDDVEALTGSAAETLLEIARIGERHGRGLLQGDIVILGAVLPPAPIGAAGSFCFTLSGHPTISVDLTP